ncbi:MAG: IS1 family transposase [Phycisphaerales bacterium]|nr:IS1 family transposase [Phycisphaerales bacterium]MCB9857320.1 IS1 family transposase [Phycisphaerales bacterium]MCB9862966.1 IS1 family transposase [Phycisphaerales bacterium]
MNKLKRDKQRAVVAALVEGNSINSTVRMSGVAKTTILRLLEKLGCACSRFHDEHVRGLKPEAVQCDEIWSFCHSKQKNVREENQGKFGHGDVWTWTAIDPKTKFIITYYVGLRSPLDAYAFMDDLSGRVIDIGTLTTDGYGAYPAAIRETFGRDVNYAQLIKVYRAERPDHARYSPAACIGTEHKTVSGFPDPDEISTSIVERSNLTIRMSMRRFTRLTNGHSKKIENHGHAFALFTMHYNFARKHSTLGTSPAVAAGLADHLWTLDELIGLVD